MHRVKNQHYVPRSYLRKFANADEQVYVFDKVTAKSFQTHIRGVASQAGFYDFGSDILEQFEEYLRQHPDLEIDPQVTRTALDPQLIEHDLSQQEGIFARVLDDLVAKVEATGRIDEGDRLLMAYFLTIQLLRTPDTRNLIIEAQEKLANEIGTRFFDFAEKHLGMRFDREYAALEHAKFMYNPEIIGEFTRVLQGHIWRIGVNHTGEPLYTSDHPIIMRSHADLPSRGIASPGIEISFPLTPNYVLVLCDRAMFAPEAANDLTSIPLTLENVTYYNSGQVLQSNRQVYCPIPQFALAEQVCREHPEACRPNRSQAQVVSSSARAPRDKSTAVSQPNGQQLHWPANRQPRFAVPRSARRRVKRRTL
jgi:hypothetical protein